MTLLLLPLIDILVYLVLLSSAQQLDPIVNMCVRFDHQSVVKNNTLYIDGGRETFIDIDISDDKSLHRQIGNVTQGYNNYLIAIDLSSSWDWKTNISEKIIDKNPNPSTGTSPPVLARGALYHGTDQDDSIYLWGGTTSYWNKSFPNYMSPTPQQYSLWSFNLVKQEWDQHDVTLGSPNRPSSGSYAEAGDQGLSFYFNGELDSGSEIETQKFGSKVKQFLPGMIIIDTHNQTAKNLLTATVSGENPRTRGDMQYIPTIGPKGILVQIGGFRQSVTNTTDPSPVGDLLPMDEIDIFDISSYYNASTPDGTWYKQSTSGDIPQGRIDFCLEMGSASDGSSHNIYMYGGRNASNYLDDMWVLSLPGFIWEKIYDGTAPRAGHKCHLVGSRTIITVGGSANSNYGEPPCDWERKGVGVCDMSDVTWGSVYDSAPVEYRVPARVVAKIGGSPSGNATIIQPSGGFSNAGLAQLFGVKATTSDLKAPTPTTTITPPAPPVQNPEQSRSSKHRGPIIGGVLGGTLAVTALVSLGLFYRFKIQCFINGTTLPLQEMDGKVVKEIMDKDECWELPADVKPVELWSPIDRQDRGLPLNSERHLKFINQFF